MSQSIILSSEPISPHFNGSSSNQQDTVSPQEPLNQPFELPAIKGPAALDHKVADEALTAEQQKVELKQILNQNSQMYQSRWSNFSHLFKEQKFYAKAYDICRLNRRNRFQYDSKSCEPRGCVDHKYAQTEPLSPRFAENPSSYGAKNQTKDHLRRSSSMNHFIPPSDISTNISDRSHHIIASSLLPNPYESDSSNVQKFSDEKEYSTILISPNKNDNNTKVSDSSLKSKLDQIEFQKPFILAVMQDDSSLHHPLPNHQEEPSKNVIANPNYLKENKDSFLSSYFDFTGRLQESSMMKPDALLLNSSDLSNPLNMTHQKKISTTTYDPSVIYDFIDDDPNEDVEDEDDDDDQNLQKENKQQLENTQQMMKRKKTNDQVKVKLIGDPTGKKADNVSVLYHEGASKNAMYSNNNITDIKSLIGPEIMANIILNPELIIIEGDLMKYKPGIHFKYVKRWIQITKNEIKYYKSRWNANCWDSKPLVTVPFKDIKAVYRVNIKLPKNIKTEGTSKMHKGNEPKLYHFEIFTHNHSIPYMEELDTTIHHMDTSSLEDMKSEKPSMVSMLTAKEAVTSTPRKIEKDHLMPLPLLRKRNDQNQNPNVKPKPDLSEKILRESIVNPQSGMVSNLKGKPQNNHQTFTIMKKTASTPVNAKTPQPKKTTITPASSKKANVTPENTNKAKYHYVKNIEDLASWSGREKEWYYSEKRLLFSSPSNKEREIWLSIINWLIELASKRKIVEVDA